VDNALDKVMQLRGGEFTWKSIKAHAIGMDYAKVTVLLVEALKTQEKKIAELEAR
jgi:hypothetical protein